MIMKIRIQVHVGLGSFACEHAREKSKGCKRGDGLWRRMPPRRERVREGGD